VNLLIVQCERRGMYNFVLTLCGLTTGSLLCPLVPLCPKFRCNLIDLPSVGGEGYGLTHGSLLCPLVPQCLRLRC
jgi:hypothetical protein